MTDQSIELKGTNFTLSVIHLFEDQIDKIKAGLQEKVAQAPSFFKFAPIVINVSHIPNFNQWSDLKTVLNDLDLCLVGISGCKDPMIKSTINKSGLAVLTEGKAIVPNKPCAEQPLEQETKPSSQNHTATAQSLTAPITPNKTKVITTPIRSGQQIYAKNTDLIIMNNVGAGAEIIADGNIHVYGIMRGKAIAGATGDESAQIFCKHLEAELISIAGNYWLSDKINNEFIGQSVVINYNNNQLNIQLL